MTKLAYLHEPGVLDNLRSRYDINEIYVCNSDSNPPNSLPCILMFLYLLDISAFEILLPDLHWEYIDCCESFHKASSFI